MGGFNASRFQFRWIAALSLSILARPVFGFFNVAHRKYFKCFDTSLVATTSRVSGCGCSAEEGSQWQIWSQVFASRQQNAPHPYSALVPLALFSPYPPPYLVCIQAIVTNIPNSFFRWTPSAKSVFIHRLIIRAPAAN